MRRGRIITSLGVLGAAAMLIAVPGAYAASPIDIAEDLADGRLDNAYSQADLTAYLQNATLQGYDNPVPAVTPPTTTTSVTAAVTPPVTPAVTPPAGGAATPPATPVEEVLGVQSPVVPGATPAAPSAAPKTSVAGVQSPPLDTTRTVGSLPFTGIDLALLTIGGAFLLGFGLFARRLGRNH